MLRIKWEIAVLKELETCDEKRAISESRKGGNTWFI